MEEGLSLNYELITAVIVGFIALLALFTSLWQGKATREHNKLSVKPLLNTWTQFKDDRLVIDLINSGIGPAIIVDFAVVLDNERIVGRGSDPLLQALNLMFPDTKFYSQQSYFNKGCIISPNETRVVFSMDFIEDTNPSLEEKAQSLNRLKLIFDYESIYGVKDRYEAGPDAH